MSNHEQPTPSHPKSDVRNTTGKNKQTPQDSVRTTSAVDLEEFCEKHYEKLLPIMADKYEYEKRKKEKLEEVKARLDFGDARKKSTRAQESAYRTISPRRQRRSRSPRHNPSVFTRLRRERSRSPRHEYKSKERRESTVFKRLGSRGRSNKSAHSEAVRKAQETDPFNVSETVTSSARKRKRMPNSCETYNGSEEFEDHLKNFQAAAKMERWPRLFFKGKRRPQIKKGIKVPQPGHQEGGHRQNFKKGGGFRSQHKTEKRPDRFTLLTKTPKEILALEKGKFKTPPPMTTPVEKRNANKFCDRETVTSTKSLELKPSTEKTAKNERVKTSGKEKPQAILMIQSRQKAVRQKITQSFSPDLEISFPSLGNDEGTEGPLIIEAEIGGHQVHRMCIDGGSSFEILYEHCFNRLRPEIRNQMVPAATSLVGFSGEIKWPLGQITLLVKIGDDEHSTSAWMDFMVVRSTSPHNGIIGRPGLRKIQAVPSTAHGMIKFPVIGGILTLKGSKIIPVECAMVSGPEEQPILVNKVKEERVKVAINPEHPEQTVMIGSDLTEKTRSKLCNLLQRSLDIFAWTPTDMTGVPRQIAEHRLNVRKGCQPVRQKKRGQAAERNVAINDEVSKLVTAGIMREVHYHDWLSNPVMVKKSDNSWISWLIFKDLNKA
ncbi:reverse transcriptase domain-containing protein [Tanacetum coccineum]